MSILDRLTPAFAVAVRDRPGSSRRHGDAVAPDPPTRVARPCCRRRRAPPSEQLDRALKLIHASRRTVVAAGKGAVWAQASVQLEELAERIGRRWSRRCGQRASSSAIRGRGISGGFTSEMARELLAGSDC